MSLIYSLSWLPTPIVATKESQSQILSVSLPAGMGTIWFTKVTLKKMCVKGLGYWRTSQLRIHLNTQDSGKMTRRMDMESGKTKIGKGGIDQSWL